jgi:hypothetical protein
MEKKIKAVCVVRKKQIGEWIKTERLTAVALIQGIDVTRKRTIHLTMKRVNVNVPMQNAAVSVVLRESFVQVLKINSVAHVRQIGVPKMKTVSNVVRSEIRQIVKR